MKILQKINKTFMAVALGALIISSASSCGKNDDPIPVVPDPPKNIAQIVASTPAFSLLNEAIVKANLTAALSTGTLTVFAPDNDAFAASGITSATITSLTAAQLTDILTYHVVGAKVVAANVPASDTVKSLQGKNLYASKNANGVFVNGSKVKTADVSAANGVIHVISSVLTPPTKTIAELATATPSLSLLLKAVSIAGLVPAVSGAAKYTVFAPNNAAFIAAGFPTNASLDAAPVAAVTDIVKAHVLNTNVFASDLIAGAVVPTIKTGTTLTLGTPPTNVKITGSAQPNSAVIVGATTVNIIATNGVIHVIDRVLLTP